MQPPLVTVAQMTRRLPEVRGDEDRAGAFLEDASALVRAVGRRDWTMASVPDEVATIVINVAIRAWHNPGGASVSEGIGGTDYGVVYNDVWLTPEEREMVIRAAGQGTGLWALETTRESAPAISDVPDPVAGWYGVSGASQDPWERAKNAPPGGPA